MKPEVNDCRTRALCALALWLCAAPAMAEEAVRLTCAPRSIEVVPGEPVRVELTIEAREASPRKIHVPADPLLILRAVERSPVQRTREGTIVHRRVVIWQAVEPGRATIGAISVQAGDRKYLFPEITITVSDPGP